MMMLTITMMLSQVGAGDDYVLTVGVFNIAKSTLGDSMIKSSGSRIQDSEEDHHKGFGHIAGSWEWMCFGSACEIALLV